MAAMLEEQAQSEDVELESIDAAIAEVMRRFVSADIDRGRLEARMMELTQDRDELRRKRARNALDAYLPPITFYSIDCEVSTKELDDLDRKTAVERVNGVVTVFRGRRTPKGHLLLGQK
jgi:hypothetical protein